MDDSALPIDSLRRAIDDVDRLLIEQLNRRSDLSRRIQAIRMHTGGARVDLHREREVFAAYLAGLGFDGAMVADSVLRLCRGTTSGEFRA